MELLWNDGGRSASGFVGLTGDCVTRAVAIGTGTAYRDVYQALGKAAEKSPRRGLPVDVCANYLAERGWTSSPGYRQEFSSCNLPKGIVIAHIVTDDKSGGHMCAVIDHIIHDTWNASDDEYLIETYWTAPPEQSIGTNARRQTGGQHQELTQQEFDKILRRLRALDNTASNSASTEGEKHNAIRMMQDLMLRHNLSREDITDDDNVEGVQFTRMACPVNSSRACTWEVLLSSYVTEEIFPTVQWYSGTKGHRKLFWFYGPWADVQNCIAIFKELLLTIASSAQLQYGGWSRGSGASYCEGYVLGLPRSKQVSPEVQSSSPVPQELSSSRSLIQMRTLALQEAACQWLWKECNIKLTTGRRRGRGLADPEAASRGRQHGASHKMDIPGRPKRLN